MTPAPHRSPAERLTLTIDQLCRILAAQGVRGRLTGALLTLVWLWLRRTALRFTRLAARVEAGTCRHAPRPARPAISRPRRARPRPRLPRGFGWVCRLVTEANASRSQLEHLLADPEMTALIAAAPSAGRLLRPLCRMLGATPPPGLARKPREVQPATPQAATPQAATPQAVSRPAGDAPPRPAPRFRATPRPPFAPAACGPPLPA